ncbi:hypothetical protein RZS08_10990, partial [Arthrospira platensis SPKY1]|nr:hypothetical protein [Arthrospira platensis SPKY1]
MRGAILEGRSVELAQVRELFGNAPFHAARSRLVPRRRLHAVGQVAFPRGVGIGLVVCVAVCLAVVERLHELG